MNCPVCGKDALKVKDTRHDSTGTMILRRRQCIDCEHNFFTKEVEVEYDNCKVEWNKADRHKNRPKYFAKEAYDI